jgi:VWFA-related protein
MWFRALPRAQSYYVFYSGVFFPIRIALVLAGLLLGSLTLVAQSTPQSSQPSKDQSATYALRVNAKTVILDVVVTDKQGQAVTNLQQEDFSIQEDGEPQRITSFERPGTHSLKNDVVINSTADLDREAPQAPVDLIVLDEINSRFEDMAFSRYSLKKYFDAQPGKLSQPTMLVAVDLHHMTVLQDYTQDKASILKSLNQHLSQYPWHLDTASWTAERFSAAFASLMQAAEATAGHPGHKNMIWIGRGFPDVRTDTMQPKDETQLEDSIQLCINMLRDARITLYTVDPAGVPSAPTPDVDGEIADPFGGNFQFNDVATATGGKAFFGRNDVNVEIGSSVRDGASFYTLSYTPPGTSDAAKPFRGIRVVMKNSNLRAVAREGYYSSNNAEPSLSVLSSANDRTKFDLIAASETTLIYDGIPITLSSLPNDPAVIRIRIGHEGIAWTNPQLDTDQTANVQVLIATFDRKSKLIARTVRNLVVRNTVAPEGEENNPQDINMVYRLPTDDSAIRLRVVVRVPKSGRVGAANMDISTK